MTGHQRDTVVTAPRSDARSEPTVAEAFDPARNAFGFVRWALAIAAIVSLAGPLGGFAGGGELGSQWSLERSIAGVAVGGFLFVSGFLVTRSRLVTTSTPRFLWKRAMRIVPGLWLALLVTAFVIGPLAWLVERGDLGGFLALDQKHSALTYVWSNMFLFPGQGELAGLGSANPLAATRDELIWNGSIANLVYLVGGSGLIALLGATGTLRRPGVVGVVAGSIIALATLQAIGAGDLGGAVPLFADADVLVLGGPFAFGMLVAGWGSAIPLDGRLAAVVALVAAVCYVKGGWLVLGQYAFYYLLLWIALRVTRLSRWERFGDFSYGLFLIAWPVMQLAASFGLQNRGAVVYLAVVIVACHLYALLSWVLVEKPAQGLKLWTPRPLSTLAERLAPARDAVAAAGARLLGPVGRGAGGSS